MAFTNRGPGDSAYTTSTWAANRAHWKQLRKPCARCNRAIDYEAPYFITRRGKRTVNPVAFVCGHIVDKAKARRMGWTEAQTNALANTQPECAGCSIKSGAKAGNKAQKQRKSVVVARYL